MKSYIHKNFPATMFRSFFKSFFLQGAMLLIVFRLSAQDTIQHIIPGRTNDPAQYGKPYVILVSADGFRYDLAEKYNAAFLKEASTLGVKAVSMQPCFPTSTFPNHYTLVTGLYPAHHGIVDNTFYDQGKNQVYRIGNRKAVTDPSWYGGTPLWVLAESQHLLSACFYWIGSESHIGGVDPTYYYDYNEAIPIDRRIEVVKEWLQLPDSIRPHLITFYFPEVDHAEHRYGTASEHTRRAVHFVDEAMRQLDTIAVQSGLPVNFIFVSDHGMTDVDTLHPLRLPVIIDTARFKVTYGTTTIHLYTKSKKYIKPIYRELKKKAKGFDVFLTRKTPRRWHYRKKDDRFNRIGDIILTAQEPKVFSLKWSKPLAGQHGYDNALPDMQATFYAWGPAFKSRYVMSSFSIVDVYPLIAHILGLSVTQKTDGRFKVLQQILK